MRRTYYEVSSGLARCLSKPSCQGPGLVVYAVRDVFTSGVCEVYLIAIKKRRLSPFDVSTLWHWLPSRTVCGSFLTSFRWQGSTVNRPVQSPDTVLLDLFPDNTQYLSLSFQIFHWQMFYCSSRLTFTVTAAANHKSLAPGHKHNTN